VTLTPTLSLTGRGSAQNSGHRQKSRPRCRKIILKLTASAFICLSLPALAAGNLTAGRQKALQCQTCHGLDGLSKLPEAPHLAGQPEPYLVKSLNDYRKGIRKNDMMTLVVEKLTDQDVADLAAFYAAIEVTVTPPK
jgi:cytochrome c553